MAQTPRDQQGLRGEVRSRRGKHILVRGEGECKAWAWEASMGRGDPGESAAEAKGWWGPGTLREHRVGWHLQQQLHDVHVHQPQDRLPVDVGDEVSGPQARLVGRAPLLHALGGDDRVSGPTAGDTSELLPLTLPQFPRPCGEGMCQALDRGEEDKPPTVHVLARAISVTLTEGLCLPVRPVLRAQPSPCN